MCIFPNTLKETHTITKINYNIDVDSTIAGSMNAQIEY